ncbi:MAG: sugar ABC transporter permease [Clostridia bacterium]|nr:sugar ABC transporter permease [Clostridia bacterium]
MSNYQASKAEGVATQATRPPIYPKRKRSGDARRARIKETIFYMCIVVPPMIQLSIFYIYVNFDAFFMSFQKYNAATNTFSWVGFSNYGTAIADLFVKGSWLNTSLIQTLLGYVLSYVWWPLDIIFAYYVYKKMPGWSFFKGMLYLPTVLSGMVLGLINKYLFDMLIPEIALSWFNVIVDPLIYSGGWRTWWFMFWWNGIVGIGGGLLLYCTMMNRIPETLTEYARLEGVGPLREFVTLTLPLIWGTVAINLVGGVADIFAVGGGTWFMYYGTGSTNPTSVGYYIYCLTLDSDGFAGYPMASACGMFFTFIAIPLTFFVRWITDKMDPKVQY